MKIIVGLGNIGEKYAMTRHNAGFIFLDFLAHNIQKESGEAPKWKEDSKLKAFISQVNHKGHKLLLVKPTTFMNLSGQSISAILSFHKEPIENLVVIYDDIDIPLGTIRIRDKGSAGTHNGMKSIIQELGTEEFTRIRLGIESRGETSPAQQDLHSFVLTPFNGKEQEIFIKELEEAYEKLISML